MNPIPYGKQDITQEDIEAVVKTLQSEFLTQGPKIQEFEEAFAQYTGARYAVVVSNGTAALHLSALALNVTSETRVITTPITFAASANCVLYCGGKVEFADIDPTTLAIDVASVRRMLESKPKGYYHGIIPVDFGGLPVNMEQIGSLAKEYGLWVIQDACHSPGGSFVDSSGKIQKCGANGFADLSIFSFHPVKHVATGEGGMITTNDESLYRKLLKLRTHGITKDPNELIHSDGGWYYEMQELGYNYRMPDILCALGLSQLKMADDRLERRIEIAKTYDRAFQNNAKIKLAYTEQQLREKRIQHAYHLYVIQVNDRLSLYKKLRTLGIYTQVHYIPVYKMPYYQRNGHQQTHCEEAEKYYQGCLSLPMYPTLTTDEQSYVISSVLKSI